MKDFEIKSVSVYSSISGVERIVVSEDNKVNGKSCKVWGNAIKDFHDIDRADCFEYYNSAILNFINSKLN